MYIADDTSSRKGADVVMRRAADDVFVLGGNRDIAHFNGDLWAPMAPLDVSSLIYVNGMAVTRNMVVAVGAPNPTAGRPGIEGLLRTQQWICRTCERDKTNRIDDDCDGDASEEDPGCER